MPDKLLQQTSNVSIQALLQEIKRLSEQKEVDENRIWELLNAVEELQKSFDVNSPGYQQFITEVKTTLLPLIPPIIGKTQSNLSQVWIREIKFFYLPYFFFFF